MGRSGSVLPELMALPSLLVFEIGAFRCAK